MNNSIKTYSGKVAEWTKLRLKRLSLGMVCIGTLLALVFSLTSIYDLNSNLLSSLPTIIIIGGAIGFTLACKKESKY